MVVVKKKVKKKKKITAEIVATTSLPVDRLTATDCNAAARANKCFSGTGGISAGPTFRIGVQFPN